MFVAHRGDAARSERLQPGHAYTGLFRRFTVDHSVAIDRFPDPTRRRHDSRKPHLQ
jgi:hypothetical protein